MPTPAVCTFGFLNPENTFLLLQAIQCVVLCYNSPGKPLQVGMVSHSSAFCDRLWSLNHYPSEPGLTVPMAPYLSMSPQSFFQKACLEHCSRTPRRSSGPAALAAAGVGLATLPRPFCERHARGPSRQPVRPSYNLRCRWLRAGATLQVNGMARFPTGQTGEREASQGPVVKGRGRGARLRGRAPAAPPPGPGGSPRAPGSCGS